MSDPVTNVEIEDMLSSIRRLISEDVTKSSDKVKLAMDRFVLTPALRVPTLEDASQTDDPSKTETKPKSSGTLVLGGANTSSASDPEDAWESLSAGEQSSAVKFNSSRTELEARIAELEAAVARSREEWEPDGSEPDDSKHTPDRHIFAHAEPEKTEEKRFATEARPPREEVTPTAQTDDAGGSGTSSSYPTVVGSEIAERQSRADQVDSDGSEELLVDEDVLRDLVAEIVRRELQGALGERITRAVRRMVRREIQQALALKDFQ